MPLYITKTGVGEAVVERLVEANNKAVARNFAARGLVSVETATQADLFRLAKAGKEIEVATDAPEVQPDGGVSGGGVEPPVKPEGEEPDELDPPLGAPVEPPLEDAAKTGKKKN